MSCRVLKRGMENFVLNTIVDFARTKGFSIIEGEYIATAKNQMVKDHYLNLGFEQKDKCWLLNVENYTPNKTYIKYLK